MLENPLLMLCKAAQFVENGDCDHAYSRYSQSNFGSEKTHGKSFNSSGYSYSHASSRNKAPVPTRITHNELEKSRRAHLRKCMDDLKERLTFEDDITRITMLTVLKKATSTIQHLRRENQSLESKETYEKKRCNQLLMRRQSLRKKFPCDKNSAKFQNWRERNRNASECSVATTSSDDSELESAFMRSMQQQPPGGRMTVIKKISSPSLEEAGSDSGYESPKMVMSGVPPLANSMDKLCFQNRLPVISTGGCNSC